MNNNEIGSIIAMNAHMAKLTEQRDELLEAVKMFAEYEKAMDERDDVSVMLIYAEMSKLMRSAIAKATPK